MTSTATAQMTFTQPDFYVRPVMLDAVSVLTASCPLILRTVTALSSHGMTKPGQSALEIPYWR